MDPRVRQLYKNLLFMGKDYPAQSGGYAKFRVSLKKAFHQRKVANESDLVEALERGKYIEKELEALYYLTRYRDLKRKYYSN